MRGKRLGSKGESYQSPCNLCKALMRPNLRGVWGARRTSWHLILIVISVELRNPKRTSRLIAHDDNGVTHPRPPRKSCRLDRESVWQKKQSSSQTDLCSWSIEGGSGAKRRRYRVRSRPSMRSNLISSHHASLRFPSPLPNCRKV